MDQSSLSILAEIWSVLKEIIFPALVGLGVWIFKTQYSKRQAKKDEAATKHKDGVLRLKYHSIFSSSIQHHLTSIKLVVNMRNPVKTKIFIDLLENFLLILYDQLKLLAEEMDECALACVFVDSNMCNKLYNSNITALNNTIEKFSTYYRVHPGYSLEDIETLDTIMVKFIAVNTDSFEAIRKSIKDISDDKYISTDCRIAQALIFNKYIGIISAFITSASTTFQTLNGDLNGKKFRGEAI